MLYWREIVAQLNLELNKTMNRSEATKYLRAELDSQNLNDWKIRLVSDLYRNFLGMCSYKDKTIILNAHHIDTHPEIEVINKIKHEVAHALCPNHGHDEVWKAKAIELGCDNPSPCVTYSFDERAIDAIRSGATLEVTFEETIVREPKYKISRLQDKCPTCGKVAKEKSRTEVRTSKGHKIIITLECFHVIFKDADSTSPFEDLVFDGNPSCKHEWGVGKERTTCKKCDARRLYKYQVEGARALERNNGRFALFDDQGLGKTIQVIAYLKFHENDAFPFLWVTKSKVKFQHAKEIIRVLGKQHFPQVIMSGKDTLIPGMNTICSYDIFRSLDLEDFEKHGYKCLILDECQAIKNPDSARTHNIRAIAKNIPKIIPTSASPWKNNGEEYFPILNILDPVKFHSFKHYCTQWVDYPEVNGKVKKGGINNPQAFKEYISHLAIRRERIEVMPELPVISRNKMHCEIPDYARKTYNAEQDKLVKIYNDAVLEGKEDSFEAKSQMQASIMVMRQIVAIAKVPTTVAFAQEFLEETDRKLIIFVHHIKCGDMIYDQLTEWCKENGLQAPLRAAAGLDAIKSNELQEAFNGPNHRVLIASTLSSGEGLNLQTCSDIIMHERQWNPQNEEQAEGRIIRIGQNAEVATATYIYADDSVDTDAHGLIEFKRANFHNAMNKGHMPVWNEQDFIKDLAAIIASKKRKAA